MAGPTQNEYLARTKTAQDVIAEANTDAYRNEPEAREAQLAAVESAGVINESYLDYGQALANYEARSDTESLASRRARDVGTIAEQDYMRQRDQRPANPS
jgi:hypothetical protein